MSNGKNYFDQPLRHDLRTYNNIRKLETGQVDNYTTSCLLDYPFFKKHYKMTAIDLYKQLAVDADPKSLQ